MRTFTSVEDVYEYFGVEKRLDEKERREALSRRFYKFTDCGGWLSPIAPGERIAGKETQQWRAYAKMSEGHYRLVAVSYEAFPRRVYFPSHENVPSEVLDYFDPARVNNGAEPGETYSTPADAAYFNDLAGRDHGWTPPAAIVVPKMVQHAGGVLMGTIVEGSDVEITMTPLYFPFDVETFDAMVQQMEADAAAEWDAANADREEEDE